MATAKFTSKLFVFSKTAHTGLRRTFNRKTVRRLSLIKIPKNVTLDVEVAFYSLMTRFDYDEFDFRYAYLIEDSTEQERILMKLMAKDSDYIAFISDMESCIRLNTYFDVLNNLSDNLNAVEAIQANTFLPLTAVGLSTKKLNARVKSLFAELENNIARALEKFDATFRI